ncbi:hypothetical protein [Flavobacterium sp. LB1P71]|uniref:hypothetical protein n=1 Tax=unclassified Flavobacterium TaxID=196869 RepID=UPI003AAE37FB
MKKHLMLLLIFSNSIMISCDKKSNKNDLEKENLQGNVISVKQSNFKVTEKFGEPVKGEKNCVELNTCEIIKKYNDLGNEIEFSEFDSFGIAFITKIKYNEKNQKVEQNRYTPEEGKRVMQFKSKYDLSGNCIELSSDAGYIEKKEYDKNNNLIKEHIKYAPFGEFVESTYFYNEKNEIIRKIYAEGKTEYSYFEDGNIKDEIYYNKDGSIQTKGSYTYEYDEHKNWKVQIAYDDGVPISYSERIIEYKN